MSRFRNDYKLKENVQFILTKAHSILYYEHTYSLNKYSDISFDIPKNDFINAFKKSKNFLLSEIKDYLNNNEIITNFY